MLAVLFALAVGATPPPLILARIEDETFTADRELLLDAYERAVEDDRGQSIVVTFELAVVQRRGISSRDELSAMVWLTVRPEAWLGGARPRDAEQGP